MAAEMIAAIAMSALSAGALLELAVASFIRGRAGRRRNASATMAPAAGGRRPR